MAQTLFHKTPKPYKVSTFSKLRADLSSCMLYVTVKMYLGFIDTCSNGIIFMRHKMFQWDRSVEGQGKGNENREPWGDNTAPNQQSRAYIPNACQGSEVILDLEARQSKQYSGSRSKMVARLEEGSWTLEKECRMLVHRWLQATQRSWEQWPELPDPVQETVAGCGQPWAHKEVTSANHGIRGCDPGCAQTCGEDE